MHAFFCDTIMENGSYAELEERDSRHLFKTLRAKPGEYVELLDGNGIMAAAEVNADGKLLVIERRRIAVPDFRLHLYIAPPRRNKMDDLLRQCVELGVWSVNPLSSERSVSEPDSNSINGRWRAIAIEACKQSRNPFLPEIRETIPLDKAVSSVTDKNIPSFFGCVNGVKAGLPALSGDAALFIGPEGGFTEKEEQLMSEKGFTPLRLGNWTLRIETAALCIAGLLMFHGNRPD